MTRGAELFKKFCFAAGTPLLTPDGHKAIEEFKEGDLLLSASDSDALSEVGAQRVLQVFSNYSPVIELRVRGRVVRTTAEHPVFAWGKGWVPAGSLHEGDRLRSHDGKMVRVEAVLYTGEQVEVYNLHVAQWHTYFVGCQEWDFSLWAHNTEPAADGANTCSNAPEAVNNAGEKPAAGGEAGGEGENGADTAGENATEGEGEKADTEDEAKPAGDEAKEKGRMRKSISPLLVVRG
jgi:hypothetical protein